MRSSVSDSTVPPDRWESPTAQFSVESSTGVPTGYGSEEGAAERTPRSSESSPAEKGEHNGGCCWTQSSSSSSHSLDRDSFRMLRRLLSSSGLNALGLDAFPHPAYDGRRVGAARGPPSTVALRALAGRRVDLLPFCCFGDIDLLEFCRPNLSTWSAVNGHGPSMVTLLFLPVLSPREVLDLSSLAQSSLELPSFSRILRAAASRASRRRDRLVSDSSGSSTPPSIPSTAAPLATAPTHASLS